MERIAKAPMSSPVILSTKLRSTVSQWWNRLVQRTAPYTHEIGIYGEDIILTDAVERDLIARELHPYSY